MKNLIKNMALIVILTIMANRTLYAQTCQLVGKDCQGNCGTWYFRNGQQPSSAGQPDCVLMKIEKNKDDKTKDNNKDKDKDKDKYECHCVLIHSSAFCTSTDGADCDGDCPSVYPTMQDAINDTNAIQGDCITQRTGDNVYCACKYTK